jgi:hypothetical protein
LLATTKNYVHTDDTEKIIKEDVGGPSRLEHPPRHDNNHNNHG